MLKSWQTSFATVLVAAGMIVDGAQASPAGMTASRPAPSSPVQATVQPVAERYAAAPRTPAKTSSSPWQYMSNAVSSSPIATAFKEKKHAPVVTRSTPPTDSISLSTPTGPPTPQLMIAMAQLHEERGDSAQARQIYQQSLAKWPGNPELLRAAARMEDRVGQLTVAESLYKQVVTANPQNAGALNDLGLCLARQGKSDASLTVLEQAVRLAPDNVLFRNNAATMCVETRQDQRAMAHLSAVHTPADVQFNMGQLLVARNRNSEAEHYYKAALEANPNMKEAAVALSQMPGHQPVPPATMPKVADTVAKSSQVGAADMAATGSTEAGSPAAQQPIVPTSPQVGPQLGPQMTYPSEARNDGYNRSTYTPPAYQPLAIPTTPVAGQNPSVYSQPTVPWVGQATPRYLPAVGGSVQAGAGVRR